MFKSLQKIDNFLVRIVTGAVTGFSIVTLIFAVVLGLNTLKGNKSNHQIGVYSSLLGLVAGAVIAGVIPEKATEKSAAEPDTSATATASDEWKDWRNFVVERKVKESQEITSFYLKPQDGKKLPDFKPGQFLTIKLDIPQQSRPVIRTYSLSDYHPSGAYYRLSIKRETAPKDLDVPPGVASNFMHDRISEGAVIPCKPPSGKFFIEVQNSQPAVLISNGVGITPMIAMAKACTQHNPSRKLWFLHGARNSDYHAFRQEVNAIAEINANLRVYYKYSRPRPEDAGCYDSEGYIDKALFATKILTAEGGERLTEIQQVCQTTNAEYFLCGSPAFMDEIREGLSELGVSEDQVFFESFSKGGKTKGHTEKVKNNNAQQIDSAEIVCVASGKTLTWTSDDGTILECAEANGINPPSSCRQGICLTCMSQLKAGEVAYTESPTNEPDEGNVLICICQPKTSQIVLDI